MSVDKNNEEAQCTRNSNKKVNKQILSKVNLCIDQDNFYTRSGQFLGDRKY